MSMKPVNDTLKLIGNTPVYQIGDSNVFVKLENTMPAAVLKTVLFMVCYATLSRKV